MVLDLFDLLAYDFYKFESEPIHTFLFMPFIIGK